jgi:transcription antitermination factor NusG
MICWHVFACRPGKERAAAQELGRRGLLPLVPVLPIKYRQGNRYWRPLALPGYVLVQVETLTPKVLRQILAAEFIGGEKCVRREIGRATAKQMLDFLAFIQSLREVLTVKQSVKAGDVVRVKFGPMEGKLAQVQSVKGDRVNLLIELFKVEVKADALQLEKDATSPSNSLHKESKSGTTIRRDGGRSSAAGGQSRIPPSERPRARLG